MRSQRFSVGKLHIALLSAALVAIVGAGCSTQSRHEVLTIFFTGVPEPGQEQAYEESLMTPRQRRIAIEEQRKQQPYIATRRYVEPKEYVHGPFGAGACGVCHGVTGPGDRINSSDVVPRSTGSLFVAELTELCIGCHTDQGRDYAAKHNLWAHGPVANGLCLECHDPHSAPRRYLLRAPNSIELCTNCHEMNDLLKTEEHARDPRADCLACHNPHLGETSALLRSQFDELAIYR